jgi:hypothetical protein
MWEEEKGPFVLGVIGSVAVPVVATESPLMYIVVAVLAVYTIAT